MSPKKPPRRLKETSTIRFIFRPKLDKDLKVIPNEKGPIDLIYSLHGDRKFFRTEERMIPANWDQENQKADYRVLIKTDEEIRKALTKTEAKKLYPGIAYELFLDAREADNINSELSAIKKEIKAVEDLLRLNGITYSSSTVMAKLKETRTPHTKKEEYSNNIPDFIDQFVKKHEPIGNPETDNNKRKPGSLSVYKSLRTHLMAFVKAKNVKASFDAMDKEFFESFETFLVSSGKLNNTTVDK